MSSERTPEPSSGDRSGRCPRCGQEVRPRDDEVFAVGFWDGRDGEERWIGGTLFATNCRECGVVLKTYGRGRWPNGDPTVASWYTDGLVRLVGGDRWRGRPGAWSPDDAPRHETRLRALRERLGSLEEAVRVLHAAAGLGMLHLVGLVERAAGLSADEAKRLVVRSLAPD